MTDKQWDQIIITPNAYRTDLSQYEYCVRFGNQISGYACTKELLIPLWSASIRISKGTFPGDVELFYKGKLIRSLLNAENKMLDKGRQYPYKLTKYN